jgi:phosphatidylserine decarboxylase
MMTLAEWRKTIPRDKSDKELSTKDFFRDPERPMLQDDEAFFAPADGIILYAEYTSNKLFDVKGKSFTVEALLQKKLGRQAIVIGIFMTRWDVHVNRIPYAGYLKYRKLEPIRTRNLPMLDEETDLIHGHRKTDDMEYLFNNERVVNDVFAPRLGFTYHVVQIADYDVGLITPFETEQNTVVHQNDRFSMIRWGSQVDLVVPVSAKFSYEILCGPQYHVEGAVDKLISVKDKNNG